MTGIYGGGIATGNDFYGSVGHIEALKVYQADTYGAYMNSVGNYGLMFLENINLVRAVFTFTGGSKNVTFTRKFAAGYRAGMLLNFGNATTNVAVGTYIDTIDINAGTAVLNQNASASGTGIAITLSAAVGASASLPSLWLGPNSNANTFDVETDTTELNYVRNEGGVNNSVSMTGRKLDAPMAGYNVVSTKRSYTDYNISQAVAMFGILNSTTTVTIPSGERLYAISEGCAVTGNGIPVGTTVTAIDPVGRTITLSAAATVSAQRQLNFTYSTDTRGSFGWQYMQMRQRSYVKIPRANQDMNIHHLGWSGQAIGDFIAGNVTVSNCRAVDTNNAMSFASTAGRFVWTENGGIVSDSVLTAGGFVNNGDGTFQFNLATAPTTTQHGVLFSVGFPNRIVENQPFMKVYANNTAAVAAGERLGMQYTDETGKRRHVVDPSTDGEYTVNTTSAPIAAGGNAVVYDTATGPSTTDNNGKTYANIVSGMIVDVGAFGTYQSGLRYQAVVTGTNSFRVYAYNDSGSSITPLTRLCRLDFHK